MQDTYKVGQAPWETATASPSTNLQTSYPVGKAPWETTASQPSASQTPTAVAPAPQSDFQSGFASTYGGKVVNNLGATFNEGAKSVISDVANAPKFAKDAGGGVIPTVLSALATTGHIAGDVAKTVGGAISSFITPILPDFLKSKIGDIATNIDNRVAAIPGMTPEIHKGLADVLNTTSLLGGENAKPIATEAKNLASDTGSLVKSVLPEPKLNEAAIAEGYNKSIRPSVIGKSTAGQIELANSKAVSGIKAIVQNKDALQLTDAEGNILKGATPKTVDQFSQAIAQTKKTIYDQYDALAKEAGGKGITVDTRSIAKELDPIVNSKSLAIASPETIAYAKTVQARLHEAGGIDATTAQDVIQHYNEALKAFYRNPTYGDVKNVSIDALIANKLRTALDEGITGATGQQYQALKNQYGALASMEKDVAKRTATIAKAAPQGFISQLANISSGAELLKGLVTLNPASLSVGTGIKAFQLLSKYLNNPDRMISQMFSSVEKVSPSATLGSLGKGGEILSSPKPSTFQPKSKLGQMIKEAKKSGTQGGYIANPIVSAQRDTVLKGLSDLSSKDFVNKAGKLNSDAFGEVEDILNRAEKNKDTATDVRRGQEILRLLKKTK